VEEDGIKVKGSCAQQLAVQCSHHLVHQDRRLCPRYLQIHKGVKILRRVAIIDNLVVDKLSNEIVTLIAKLMQVIASFGRSSGTISGEQWRVASR
jgi:hypothetical protein